MDLEKEVMMAESKSENTSGQGSLAVITQEIRGWNWGAFLLTFIWGVSHGVWISLIGFIPFLNIIMYFVLGVKGNEWAWRNRRWDSVQHFKRTQRKWAWWGLVAWVVSGLFGFLVGIAEELGRLYGN